MKYNKLGQPYERLNIFRVADRNSNKELCRVRFFYTGHETVVSLKDEKEGNFVDDSILNSNEQEQTILSENLENNVESTSISGAEINANVTTVGDISNISELDKVNSLNGSDNYSNNLSNPTVVAVSPKGEEIEVNDLELFCNENKLDIDAVQAILSGKQKTHKKWTFRYAE